ncbi:DUF3703 domain-containing protein, partial [Arthrospira platensis SPKY2]
MTRKDADISDLIRAKRAEAKAARRHGDWANCWQLLEDAHVLSQPWAWPHVQVHASMLVAGWKERDVVEVRGQMLRLLVGGPASAVGRYPVGNTGRARVPATRPIPVRPDLADALERAGQR